MRTLEIDYNPEVFEAGGLEFFQHIHFVSNGLFRLAVRVPTLNALLVTPNTVPQKLATFPVVL